jgi:hypothetical protein
MRRTWGARVSRLAFSWAGEMGRVCYLFAALTGCIDARGYAGDVFGELLRALGIYLHVFGHGWAMIVFACPAMRLAWMKTSDRC